MQMQSKLELEIDETCQGVGMCMKKIIICIVIRVHRVCVCLHNSGLSQVLSCPVVGVDGESATE